MFVNYRLYTMIGQGPIWTDYKGINLANTHVDSMFAKLHMDAG